MVVEMRMMIGCNGCRVLSKGCSEACSIRPCLDWIKCPNSQAKATTFLAKFYGRSGLLELIHAGPQNLRLAIFRSLMYDTCGQIVNMIEVSAGLLWSGSWQLCEDAVESVMRGAPISRRDTDSVETKKEPALKAAYDIRHVNREDHFPESRTRLRFKNSGRRAKHNAEVDLGVGFVWRS